MVQTIVDICNYSNVDQENVLRRVLGCLAADKGRSDKVLPFQIKCLGPSPQHHPRTVNVMKETLFNFSPRTFGVFLVKMNGKFVRISIGEISLQYAEICRVQFRF